MTKLYRPVGNKTLWPVGSIYLTVGDANPSTYFGGTWEKISGGFLYGAVNSVGNTSYTGTSTQGPSTNTSGSTTLTADQSGLRSHTHDMVDDVYGGYVNQMGVRGDGGGGSHWTPSYSQTNSYSTYKPGWTGGWNAEQGHTHTLSSHTHTVPYIAVWIWKRVS